jgi:hypothetical protein
MSLVVGLPNNSYDWSLENMNPDVTPYQMFLDVSVSTEKNQKNQGSVVELVITLII